MKTGNFYFVKDEFYDRFKDIRFMKNKDSIDGKEHKRACYYAYFDEKKKLYWMVPISSKIEKYQKIYDSKIRKNGKCDTILFGEVLGYKKAFLLQNMFPIIPYYIENEYVKDEKSVSINNILRKEINSKVRKIINLQRKGIELIFTDVIKIEQELLKENKKEA